MGIEPTQPDEVRSRTVLKTVRATRLHPLPLHSRKHETERLTFDDFADLDALRNQRKIVRDASSGHEHEETARRLWIDHERTVDWRHASPLHTRREVLIVSLGAAGANTALPRFARGWKRRNSRRLNDQRHAARFGDV